VKLSWKSAAFHDATLALALLAEAENLICRDCSSNALCFRLFRINHL
jgi:hypothetical protein